jgi:ankyrin repeat protein
MHIQISVYILTTPSELSLRIHTNTELLMPPIKDPEKQFLQPIVQDMEKQCYQQYYQQTQSQLQTNLISNAPQNALPKRFSTWLATTSDPVGLKVQSWGEFGESLVSAYLWVGPIIVQSWSKDFKEEYKLLPAQDGYGFSCSFHANWMISGRFTVTAFALYKLRAPYNFNIRFNTNLYAHLPIDSMAYNACVLGDWPCLRQLLADGKVGITDRTQHGDTLVHIATRTNNSVIVLRLLEVGADANAANDFGQTPLHIAVHQRADYDNSRYLIAHGANLSNQDLDGKTPLHTLYNSTSQQLIQFNQDGLDNTIQDFRGMTIAHYVAWSKSATTSDILRCTRDHVRAFGDRDERGRTLLHLTFIRGNMEAIQYLTNSPNFDPSSQSHIDWQGRTLLHYATESRRCGSAIDLLLAKGLDIHAIDSQGRTALHHAAGVGNLEAVKKLLTCGAASDMAVLDKDSRTPVQVAALCKKIDVVEYLQGLYGPQPLVCDREYSKGGRGVSGQGVGRVSVLAWSGYFYLFLVLMIFFLVLLKVYNTSDRVFQPPPILHQNLCKSELLYHTTTN